MVAAGDSLLGAADAPSCPSSDLGSVRHDPPPQRVDRVRALERELLFK
jgi:hypothetical protein